MSKIAIIGATGRAGGQLLEEALRRGHDVTAIARHASALPARRGLTTQDVDMLDATALQRALVGHDAVFSAARFAGIPASPVIDAVKQAGGKRLLVVGGAASLFVAPGQRLFDAPSFPAAYKTEAAAGAAYLEALRQEASLDWTFLSPSALFDGSERTGTFRLGKDDLLIDAEGKSRISFPDFAIAFVDELERPAHSRQRFTVGY
ncbi:MAG: NAD(P)-dependent oxidoreductase [Burkholderiales bacterium]